MLPILTATHHRDQVRDTPRTCTTRPYYRGGHAPRSVRGGTPRLRSGLSWRPRPDRPLPATVPVWTSAQAWIETVAATLKTPKGQDACRNVVLKPTAATRASIRPETVLDVAYADARAADSTTGRGVATAHATVARELGCSPKTVQRARAVLERLGLAVTVTRGRYLTTDERAEANAHHGTHQLRAASERALLMPKPAQAQVTQNVHLPRRGHGEMSSHRELRRPTRATAREGAASRPSSRRGWAKHRPLAVQRLAADLAREVPWLGRGHIGALCDLLANLGLDDTGWTGRDLVNLLDQRNKTRRLDAMPSHVQQRPLALLRHQLTDALGAVTEGPRQARQRRAHEAHAALAAQRAARAAEARDLAEQHDSPAAQATIAQAKAHMRAVFATRRFSRTTR